MLLSGLHCTHRLCCNRSCWTMLCFMEVVFIILEYLYRIVLYCVWVPFLVKRALSLTQWNPANMKSALLYTTTSGQRRIRLNTLSLSCTTALASLFRGADLDAQFTHFLKQGMPLCPQHAIIKFPWTTTSALESVKLAFGESICMLGQVYQRQDTSVRRQCWDKFTWY
jgi:hypothetical protein